MDADLQHVRELLTEMTTDQVNNAEMQLLALANSPRFVEIMLAIIRNTHEQEWLKTVAASFLNQVYYNNCTEQNAEQIYHSLLLILTDSQIKSLDKRCFEKAIVKSLQTSTEKHHLLWQDRICDFMQHKPNFDSGYLLLACLAVADIPQDTLRATIYKTFDIILASLEVCVDNANLLNEMLKMWTVIVDKLKQGDDSAQILHFMGNSPKILTLIELIYELHADSVFLCLNSDLYELNLLKYEAAELHKRFLVQADNSKTLVYQCTLESTKKNLPRIGLTLLLMAQHADRLEQNNSEDLATTFISIYQLYLSMRCEQFEFLPSVKFINMVLLPLVGITDQEREKFEESPEEFNSLAQDCCDKQTYGILKTETLKLLQTFGDKVEGCMQFTINRALQSLKVGLGFIQNFQPADTPLSIQTSFLVLSLFSYDIGLYPQQLEGIRVILCDDRTRSLPPLQLSRVFTFLAYNYSEVFKKPTQGEHWVSLALNYRTHPTTSYNAYDFVSNLFEDYFNETFLNAITEQIIRGKIPLVWEVTNKILQNHYRQLSAEGLTSIISKLYRRIEREVALLKDNSKEHTLDLINCLRVFSNILVEMREDDQQSLQAQNKNNTVITAIWPVLDLFTTAKHLHLEQEIVRIANDILDNLPNLTPQLNPFLHDCLASFKQDYDREYLVFFNQLLMKAQFPQDLQQIIDITVAVKNAFLQYLMKTLGNDNKLKGSPAQRKILGDLMIVLQTLLASFGHDLLTHNITDVFLQISSLCVRLLPNTAQDLDKTSTGRIVTSRAFNTLFLCHIHLPIDRILDHLAIIQDSNAYHGFDTKVIALCLTKEILKQQDCTALSLLLTALLTIASKSEEKDSLLEKKKTKGRLMKTAAQIRKINEFDRILKHIDTPFDGSHSPKEVITDLLTTMKTNNYQIFRTIVSALSPQVVALLKNYIEIQTSETKKRVIRKVIGIKETPSATTEVLRKHERRGSMDDDSDEEELQNLKRQRVKCKAQGKQSAKAKNKKHEKVKRLKG